MWHNDENGNLVAGPHDKAIIIETRKGKYKACLFNGVYLEDDADTVLSPAFKCEARDTFQAALVDLDDAVSKSVIDPANVIRDKVLWGGMMGFWMGGLRAPKTPEPAA
jgi:hypothetical protein